MRDRRVCRFGSQGHPIRVNIEILIDDAKCFDTPREMRWPDGLRYTECGSDQVTKDGPDDTQPERQRYDGHGCRKRFDDLTDTAFAGHHQPLRVWVLCLNFMGHYLWACRSQTARIRSLTVRSRRRSRGDRVGHSAIILAALVGAVLGHVDVSAVESDDGEVLGALVARLRQAGPKAVHGRGPGPKVVPVPLRQRIQAALPTAGKYT